MIAPLVRLAGRDERILVGADTADDAGVYRLGDRALVATADFITPVCDDPHRFGRVAAANALSDVYAMGGRPLFALNLCCFPELDGEGTQALTGILRGAAEALVDAHAVLLGGHSVRDPELKFGLSVIGEADPDRLLTNAGAKPGDRLPRPPRRPPRERPPSGRDRRGAGRGRADRGGLDPELTLQLRQLRRQPLHDLLQPLHPRGERGAGGGRGIGRSIEDLLGLGLRRRLADQMGPARLLLAGAPGELHHQRLFLGGQTAERLLDLLQGGERVHPLAAGAQLPRRLRATQPQERDQRLARAVEPPAAREALLPA